MAGNCRWFVLYRKQLTTWLDVFREPVGVVGEVHVVGAFVPPQVRWRVAVGGAARDVHCAAAVGAVLPVYRNVAGKICKHQGFVRS